MITTIKCPSCNTKIEFTKALSENLSQDLREELKKEFNAERQTLEKELREKEEKIKHAEEAELSLRKQKQELEEQKRTIELEIVRKLDLERQAIRDKTSQEIMEQQRLKEQEKDKIINDLKKSLEDAQLKATQSSQQLKGEVQELDLERSLRQAFPLDEIKPVEKGIKGADILQIVRTTRGTVCGQILYESKRTKDYSPLWLNKLKDDMRLSKANLAVLITRIMPKEISSGFGLHEGVWLSLPDFALPLIEILRKNLIDVARERHVSQDRGTKADLIYAYLTSDAFVQQIQTLCETHQEMIMQISKERIAFERSWRQREAQAQRILLGTAGIYGSIQGVAGQSLPPVKGLEIDSGLD